MEALWDEVGTPGVAATDTRASTAIELTRAWLDAVARTSTATEMMLAWLTGAARTSAVIDVARLSAISGHDLRADLDTTTSGLTKHDRDLARHPSLDQSL